MCFISTLVSRRGTVYKTDRPFSIIAAYTETVRSDRAENCSSRYHVSRESLMPMAGSRTRVVRMALAR